MSLKNVFNNIKHNNLFSLLKRYPIIYNKCHYKVLQNKYKYLHYTKKLPSLEQINKKYSSFTSDSDHETEDDIIDETESKSDTVEIRNLLHTNSNDPVINKLNDCASIQDVFDVIHKNDILDAPQITQAILILSDLQKCFYKHNINQDDVNINRIEKSSSVLRNYIERIKRHEDFTKLIKMIENNYEKFTLNELTCSMLYLNRIGVDINENVMQLMINRCEKEVARNDPDDLPLTALSRFTVTVFNNEESIWSILITKNIIPIIIERLRKCESADDFKLLTICLNKMQVVVTDDTLKLYKNIAKKLLENGKITSEKHRTVLKVVMFLSRPQWSDRNTSLIKNYMYVLKNDINKLKNSELIQLFKVFQATKEPADMLEKIQKSASDRLSEIEESEHNLEITLNLLSCVVSFSSPLQRPKFEKLALNYIENLSPLSLSSMYKILYHIKSENVKLYNKFWEKALEQVKMETSCDKLPKLLNLCHKYMHFYTDISNRYHYYRFEKEIIQLLLNELNNSFDGLVKYKFSRIAAFILAYNNNLEILQMITEKISNIRHFSSVDYLNISKGLQIAMDNAKNSNIPQKYFNQIADVLNESITNEILIKKNCELQNLNILARGFTFRKGNINSNVFNLILNSFIENENGFSSHIIRDLSYFLQINNCLVPSLVDKMSDYIVRNGESILGNTVDKLLNLCYLTGYVPENEQFLGIASNIITRDINHLSGLAFLQSALSLCFYHKLPMGLIEHIFSEEFLEKLDEELSNCYSKTTYPTRVRNYLMQLNRAVCLDYPESNIPWFHQKFVDSKQNETKYTYFQRKVLITLEDIIEDKSCISQNAITPYGYRLDFEVKDVTRKLAFLLINPNAYTKINRNLKGYHQLKKRHLEILGYEVFFEELSKWKDFCMHDQCVEYVKKKIWPKQKCKSISALV